MFISRMHTDKTLTNMLTYGLESVHYARVSDTMIEPLPGVDATKNPYYNLKWMFGNQANLYDYGKNDAGFAAALNEFNSTAIRSSAIGFTFITDKVKKEIATMTNVVAQYDPSISSGSVDAEGGLYQEFLGKLKAAGVDKVLAEANTQLKAWLAQRGK
jgi:putative aldouronate transport system substrate-binding protein